MMTSRALLFLLIVAFASSCVSTKTHEAVRAQLQEELDIANQQLGDLGAELNRQINQLASCNQEKTRLETTLRLREEQLEDARQQLARAQEQLDKQLSQVGDLTVLSQSANENIKQTLSQLETKDKYIRMLQTAKSKADSINLALAVNLKGVLSEGIEDEDVEVKVDKTVVFINLSDKMLYQSGSANITSRANEVLGKIAKIIQSRPELEVMVEGYTDNVPIKTQCIQDNWDLSVKRATSVVRALQDVHGVDPNRLIAAGRGEYNSLATNDTAEGRAVNRRTRIIILPKLNQFYDLLNPEKIPEANGNTVDD